MLNKNSIGEMTLNKKALLNFPDIFMKYIYVLTLKNMSIIMVRILDTTFHSDGDDFEWYRIDPG